MHTIRALIALSLTTVSISAHALTNAPGQVWDPLPASLPSDIFATSGEYYSSPLCELKAATSNKWYQIQTPGGPEMYYGSNMVYMLPATFPALLSRADFRNKRLPGDYDVKISNDCLNMARTYAAQVCSVLRVPDAGNPNTTHIFKPASARLTARMMISSGSAQGLTATLGRKLFMTVPPAPYPIFYSSVEFSITCNGAGGYNSQIETPIKY
jgi:hypothetical protein